MGGMKMDMHILRQHRSLALNPHDVDFAKVKKRKRQRGSFSKHGSPVETTASCGFVVHNRADEQAI